MPSIASQRPANLSSDETNLSKSACMGLQLEKKSARISSQLEKEPSSLFLLEREVISQNRVPMFN